MLSTLPRVLIVDDDGDTRDMYTVALSIMGFEPIAATNAEEAFAQARDLTSRRDCDGPHTGRPFRVGTRTSASRRRTNRRCRDHRAVGTLLRVDEQRAREAGCDRYLVKPCLPDALALEIHNVLASRHQLTALDSK